ncbi:MAG: VCBS repeat-containing protein [Oscillospiraceae bacterium]|nr:VCBS repeat-containing protein [Oscillospiraceae bacterium]MCL2278567.1 VCBS repeat-containing protein [Oscillospiraceae bacterium]
MKRVILTILLALLAMILLTGCFRTSADELFSLPAVSAEYLRLQAHINMILAGGAEFAPPTRGPNRQAVQLKDLNGDGIGEVIAFFSVIADSTLKIYIFERVGDDYVVADVITGVGTEFESIRYVDLDGDGTMELVVGWQMGMALRYMSIFSITGFHHQLLVSGEEFTELAVYDMTQDGSDDVIVFMLPTQDVAGTAKIFSMMPDGEIVSQESRLSVGVESISRVLTGSLADGNPTLFVESEGRFENGSMVTDVFAMTNGSFNNISLSFDTFVSNYTVRHRMGSSDVNRDGILKTPVLRRLIAQSETEYYAIDWYAYRSDGSRTRMLTTYHNNFDEWFLILPFDWREKVSVRREDAIPGERTIIFSYFEAEEGPHQDFLKIFKLSGANAEERAERDNRQLIMLDGATAYAFELLTQPNSFGITFYDDMIRDNFRLIYSYWITGRG